MPVKKRTATPTKKQKEAFDKMVENGGNITKAMRDVGYSENTINTPQKLTESKGWELLCKEHGLTEDFLVKALVEDIENKPKNRVQELNLGFKIVGRLNEKPEGNKTLIVNITSESAERFKLNADTT